VSTTTPRKKIMLVDDSRTALLVERALLERAYEVFTAGDGLEAVDLALSALPDLILMDVQMPRLDGPEAVARIRARPETQNIPIIMVTSRSELEKVEASYRSGCNDYVTKPIHASELLAKVRSSLGE
jgi:CheY-like chemotaxis protein